MNVANLAAPLCQYPVLQVNQTMRRQQIVSLRAWLKRLVHHPLAVPFLLAALAGAATTIQVVRSGIIPDFVLASIVAPILIGLLSLVPRIGGALSLGVSIGAGIGLVAVVV